MSVVVLVFSGLLAAVVAVLSGMSISDSSEPSVQAVLLLCAIAFVPLAACVVPSFVVHWWLGLAVLGSLILGFLGCQVWVDDAPIMVLLVSVATMCCTALLIVWFLLPSMSQSVVPSPSTESSGIDLSLVQEHFDQISSSFKDFQDQLTDNWGVIDEATTSIIAEIEEQNEQLRALQIQGDRLQEQVDYLRELSTLSEEQVEAVILSLQSNSGSRFWSNVIASLIGALGIMAIGAVVKLTRKNS